MHNVFRSFLSYAVSAVLTDGHSTGQASTGFKIRNLKQDFFVVVLPFSKEGLLLYLLTAKCSTSVCVTDVQQTFNWLFCA